MSASKGLFNDTVYYGLSSILGRFLNYLLVPLYTQVFMPAEYGVVTELYAALAFLNILYTFGLETTFFRFATKYREKAGHFYAAAITIQLVLSLVLSGAMYLLSDQLAILLEYPGQGFLIRWMGLILVFDTLVSIPFGKIRLDQRPLFFASLKLSGITVNIGFNLFFILLLPELSGLQWIYNPEWGVGYVFLSNVLSSGLVFLILLPMVRLTFSLKRAELEEIISYSFPLVILGFAGVTNEMFSRGSLKYLLPEGFYEGLTNLEALGIFGACYKLAIFMTLAVQAFKFAFEPFFFSKSDDQQAKTIYADVMTWFVAFGCLALVGITTILPELAPIFLRNDIYLTGLPIVPILLAAGLFLGIFYNLSVWYKLTDQTGKGAIISISGVVITLLGNFLLIPMLGYLGSAWASLATYFFMMVLSYLWGRRYYPVDYELSKILVLLGVAGVGTTWLTLGQFAIGYRYLIGMGFVAALLFLVYLFQRRKP